jgi:hypothetical protein
LENDRIKSMFEQKSSICFMRLTMFRFEKGEPKSMKAVCLGHFSLQLKLVKCRGKRMVCEARKAQRRPKECDLGFLLASQGLFSFRHCFGG